MWGQYLNWYTCDLWRMRMRFTYLTFAYEVNTSIFIYCICDRCRMSKRSIPQLCIMMFRVHRGYMSRLRISITSLLAIWCYDFFNICICWSCVYLFDHIHVIIIHMCVLVITWFLYQMLSFSGKGCWWPSSHFCENGVVTSIPLRNETIIATMMLKM